jgi:hypothetical protein
MAVAGQLYFSTLHAILLHYKNDTSKLSVSKLNQQTARTEGICVQPELHIEISSLEYKPAR